ILSLDCVGFGLQPDGSMNHPADEHAGRTKAPVILRSPHLSHGRRFFFGERTPMPTLHDEPIHRGGQMQLTIDFAEAEQLDEMAPGPSTRGRFISKLIANEYVRREERARLRAALETAMADE